jgi:hypothetical protein
MRTRTHYKLDSDAINLVWCQVLLRLHIFQMYERNDLNFKWEISLPQSGERREHKQHCRRKTEQY